MHPVPISDRISIIYLDKGILERDGHSVILTQANEHTAIPVGITAVLMLGPGVSVTHAAVKLCAAERTLLLWTGEEGVRTYAAGNPRNTPEPLLRQAASRNDPSRRLLVARRLFRHMFEEEAPPRYSPEQLRGLEGSRVKKWYTAKAAECRIDWKGKQADLTQPVNRALAGCNSALYGLTEAVILATGYSPSIGFVHSGDERSFVFDLADTIKFATVAPLAFEMAAKLGNNLTEPAVRHACRDLFYRERIADRLVSVLGGLFDADGCI